MQKKKHSPRKKAQKALQPIKKKAQKSTMVLLKALTTILGNRHMHHKCAVETFLKGTLLHK